MRTFAALVGFITFAAIDAAAQTPADWQVMKDRKQQCQMAAPPGWTVDKIMPGNLTSPDKKAGVIFSSKPAGVTYADIVKMAKDMFKPVKTIEETASRTWFVSAPTAGPATTTWYVAMNTNPVCEAQIKFQGAGFEATAKLMVNSLKLVK
jgi:hypothetical protein